MRKSMYSLMLMDSVVKKIDELAQEKNTNRSNLINQILAEYVSLVTPEKQISEIFSYLDQLFCSKVFSTVQEQCETMMSVKTSLDYKYRPTVKYSIELIKNPKDKFGYLKVIFRTQSKELLDNLQCFFNNFAKLESAYLKSRYNMDIEYSLSGGKFIRSMSMPYGFVVTYDELAKGISNYVAMLDELIKNYLSQKFTPFSQIEKRYLQYINSSSTVII